MSILRHCGLLLLTTVVLTACATRPGQKPPEKKKPAPTVTATPAGVVTPKVTLWDRVAYYSNPFNLLPKKKRPPVAQQPRLVGVVKMVNMEDKYVLVDAVTQSSEPGDLLLCITNQKETANLRMSSLKNPPFLIADIASGTPAVGDRVFKP